jgi:uncharacterized protein YfiM (DUF2279 family)
MRLTPILILLTIAFAAVGRSQGAAVTDLSKLAWLAGHWTGTDQGIEMEEHWLAPKANTMMGLHRDVKGGRTISFEFLRIEATADGITYWASPRGKPATPFRLKEAQDKRVVFENPEHDFPQRIIYWLGADGSLHAKTEGTISGKNAAEEWTWQRTRE